MWVNFPVTDAHQCCPGVVLILFYCRWSEVTRRLELWIQILEINENGDFVPVEVIPARDVRTGGIFQLRQVGISPNTFTVNWVTATNLILKSQLLYILIISKLISCLLNTCLAAPPHHQGQSRRIQVEVRSVQDSGTMPLIAEILLAVSVGCVEIRNTTGNQEGDEMDSYQVDQFNTSLSIMSLPISQAAINIQSCVINGGTED